MGATEYGGALIVVPLGRPRQALSVYQNWLRQRERLPIIAVVDEPIPHEPYLPHTGGPRSAGGKRNAGLEFARKLGYEWVIFWDDDNYYGPAYLDEFTPELAAADVVTRGLGFVRNGEELWHFGGKPRCFMGHSTAVRVSMAPDFPDGSGGEEIPWSAELQRRGARVVLLSPWHLVYDRTERGDSRAHGATWVEFWRGMGEATNLGKLSDSFVDSPHELELSPAMPTRASVFESLERRALAMAEARNS